MRLDSINTQRGNKVIPLRQIVIFESKSANLSSTDGCKFGRVTEENGPFALLPLMKRIKLAMSRVHGEIGHDVA